MSASGISPTPWAVTFSGGATTILSRDRSVLAVIVGGGDAAPFEAGNAALMGAAPDLRDALREAREWITGEGSIVPERLVGRISAALAKAEAAR